MIKAGKYFTIEELCRSNTASSRGIDNTPDVETLMNILSLIEYVLDPIRELAQQAVIVNSGYRCPELNKAIGGTPTSQHLTGRAADITLGTKESNRKLFDAIKNSDIDFDQLIDESNFSWIHVSYDPKRNRKQVLSL